MFRLIYHLILQTFHDCLQLLHAIQVAEEVKKPSVAEIFTDVYNTPPPNLCEQERSLRETIRNYPQDYPPDVPL